MSKHTQSILNGLESQIKDLQKIHSDFSEILVTDTPVKKKNLKYLKIFLNISQQLKSAT